MVFDVLAVCFSFFAFAGAGHFRTEEAGGDGFDSEGKIAFELEFVG